MEKARDEFDSTDFDYAILLSDNSGLFDVKKKAKPAQRSPRWLPSVLPIYKNAEFSEAEKARFNLEMGEVFYANAEVRAGGKEICARPNRRTKKPA